MMGVRTEAGECLQSKVTTAAAPGNRYSCSICGARMSAHNNGTLPVSEGNKGPVEGVATSKTSMCMAVL